MNILGEKKEISVIIPTYNRSELLEYTLKSLSLQELSKDRFEVIVADDGSTDDTRGLTLKYERLMNLKEILKLGFLGKIGQATRPFWPSPRFWRAGGLL